MLKNFKYYIGRHFTDPVNVFVILVLVSVLGFSVWYISDVKKDMERYDVDSVVKTSVSEIASHYEKLASKTKTPLKDESFDANETVAGKFKVPENTKIFIKSFGTPGKVCVYGINPEGMSTREDAGVSSGNARQCSNIKEPKKNAKPDDIVSEVKKF